MIATVVVAIVVAVQASPLRGTDEPRSNRSIQMRGCRNGDNDTKELDFWGRWSMGQPFFLVLLFSGSGQMGMQRSMRWGSRGGVNAYVVEVATALLECSRMI